MYNVTEWMLSFSFVYELKEGAREANALSQQSHWATSPRVDSCSYAGISQAFLSAAMTSKCLWVLTPVYRQNPIPDPCSLAPSSEPHF